MANYAHQPRQHQTDRYAALLAEQARLEAETQLYENLAAQRQRLAELKATFHEHTASPSPAERIRQDAIQRFGYDPEECRHRLREATADAERWQDPRTRTTTTTTTTTRRTT